MLPLFDTATLVKPEHAPIEQAVWEDRSGVTGLPVFDLVSK